MTDHTTLITTACQALAGDSPPTLSELAQRYGLSASHFQRLFKAALGISPKQYGQALREHSLREALGNSSTVTDAIFTAGYGSSSRFYEKSRQVLGMPARHYLAKGAQETIHFAVGQCSLGAILVAQSALGVCAISLGDDPQPLVQELQDRFKQAQLVGADQSFEQLIAVVVGLIDAPQRSVVLPLDIRGTAFQQQVWQALRQIPAGHTASYTEIAQRLGLPKAVRAVAQACAANPLAVAIPCHRVVRQDGQLAGYRWGIERKRSLLSREAENR